MKKVNESSGKHDGKHSTQPFKGNNSKLEDTVDKILYLNYSKGEQARNPNMQEFYISRILKLKHHDTGFALQNIIKGNWYRNWKESKRERERGKKKGKKVYKVGRT